jgi:molybdenum cofactor cytidylyltransferase
MGRQKLLLPWGPGTVIGHLQQQWTMLEAAQIAAVCTTGAIAVQAELRRLRFLEANWIFNPEPERGMFSSIQCAANWSGWKPNLTHFVITLGDQPHLNKATLQGLLDFARANPGNICQPLRNGGRRHPVLLPKRAFNDLGKSSATDLKTFLKLHADEFAGFSSEDAGLDLDLDTPADYEHLRRLYL